ncbi:hypothetical protein [Paraburkholderia fungorum]|uniref:hypothetical protein n=1 Tax=Paraburkholderia fungorum TaxID=134537 RepID=UPI0020936172|nr:hypothetical protein [Paraburkholderia fungorum]USU18557.1 hypothetical protein NFE55_22455 [Paraburkholderia fungorum]USU26501.1 hypothetical protein NFS19_22510 [Paraburkholderia fungorum]
MNSKIVSAGRLLPPLLCLGVLLYGTRGLALHRHLHLTYLALAVLGIVAGTVFTRRGLTRA